ncbi:Zn-dependent hydrolase [Oceanobacillus massiliensis]|uniref:Zn-dependent hydrolase n=1 Tax=Oceanobacillus massiliensis TaxID=1465765 RepID=UPI003018F600
MSMDFSPFPNTLEMVQWLSKFGQTKNDGVTRLLYTPSWLEAQEALKTFMEKAGFQPYYDSVGNLFGRVEGKDKTAPIILTGSHVDTVVDGGKFDGAYGVIASLIAVQRLFKKYGEPKHTMEVVSLCEEEGSRFPISYWGSRNITGEYTLDDAAAVRDEDGVSLLEAMKISGFSPDHYKPTSRTDIGCFVEIHIEQGRILEKAAKSIGLVSHIVGQKRFTITVQGESNHAGTTPMHDRKDALSIAAGLIAHITEKAGKADSGLRATVGSITASPNVSNVIAGKTDFSLDVRHHDTANLEQFCDELFRYFKDIAGKSGTMINVRQWFQADSVKMDENLLNIARLTASEKGISHHELTSGAGHDSQVFGSFCPTALLFVPSVDGISHSPLEQTLNKDLEKGVELLTAFLYKLAYQGGEI